MLQYIYVVNKAASLVLVPRMEAYLANAGMHGCLLIKVIQS